MPDSPILSREVLVEDGSFYGIHCYRFIHKDAGIGDFRVDRAAGQALMAGNFRSFWSTAESFDMSISSLAFDLIRSLLWREAILSDPPMLVTSSETKESAIDEIAKAHPGHYPLVKSFSDLVREARAQTLVSRAHETLENILRMSEQGVSANWLNPADYAYHIWKAEGVGGVQPTEIGLAFASNQANSRFVYEYLYESGLLRYRSAPILTAKGYRLIDDMRRKISRESNKVFLIRRWDNDLDEVLEDACQLAAAELGVPIEPVWARDHNEKIDELVFRSIRTAVAVVVDLTPDSRGEGDRINVGIEAGYAMALGKPIVAVRRCPDDSAPEWHKRLPFDIVTLSCYDYPLEKSDDTKRALAKKLVARLGLAIDLQTTHPS